MTSDLLTRSVLTRFLLLAWLLCCGCDAPVGEAGPSVEAQGDQAGSEASDLETYVVIVAHPDDENQIGPVLAKWAREGHQVIVIIATDGKYGTGVTDIPPGEALGTLRRQESECACRALGVSRPIFLLLDRLDTRNGVRQALQARRKLLSALHSQLEAIKPDALFTFGPDGEYGHPEHIIVGSAITELLLRDGLVEKYPLYYFAWTKQQVEDDESLGYVDARYLELTIRHSDEDERRSFEAARCYATQTTPAEIDELIRRASADGANSYSFRRFQASAMQAGSKATEPALRP